MIIYPVFYPLCLQYITTLLVQNVGGGILANLLVVQEFEISYTKINSITKETSNSSNSP